MYYNYLERHVNQWRGPEDVCGLIVTFVDSIAQLDPCTSGNMFVGMNTE